LGTKKIGGGDARSFLKINVSHLHPSKLFEVRKIEKQNKQRIDGSQKSTILKNLYRISTNKIAKRLFAG